MHIESRHYRRFDAGGRRRAAPARRHPGHVADSGYRRGGFHRGHDRGFQCDEKLALAAYSFGHLPIASMTAPALAHGDNHLFRARSKNWKNT